jgi:5-(carboxyamino)imidazole ribonucleotide synthase
MKSKPVIGVIGGGQLGRMFIEEALRYNIECIIADADPDCPASVIAHEHIVGSIAEEGSILRLSELADILTYEIEHIYIEPLLQLEREGKKKLIPSPQILKMVQDKGAQKLFYRQHGIPTADFFLVHNGNEWKSVVKESGWQKWVAKSRTEGYDGRGVTIVSSRELNDGKVSPMEVPAVLEEFVDCEKELSVIVARDQQGKTALFPLVEMEFDPRANLVTMLIAPARVSEAVKQKAEAIALKVVKALDGPGLFAIEMFLEKTGRLLVNEMAPRPHNSGHHTIEACYTSQYEQLLRILLGLPLGSTKQLQPAVMLNILGALDFSGAYYLAGYGEMLKEEGVYIHLYGKKESRPMRKLGHITVLGETVDEAIKKAERVRSLMKVRKREEA